MSTLVDVPRPHRLSVDDYYRMVEAGILAPDEHVELIEGEIIDVPPPGSLHAGTVEQLTDALRDAVGRRAAVRVQHPVRLGRYSEPQPDLAVVRWRDDYYKAAHPTAADVLLIVEVAHSSLGYDRDVKLPLYAQHAVPAFWIVDLEGAVLDRYAEPSGARYRAVDRPRLDRPIEIAALPGVRVDLEGLFAG